jgi:hypothetical protein
METIEALTALVDWVPLYRSTCRFSDLVFIERIVDVVSGVGCYLVPYPKMPSR